MRPIHLYLNKMHSKLYRLIIIAHKIAYDKTGTFSLDSSTMTNLRTKVIAGPPLKHKREIKYCCANSQ